MSVKEIIIVLFIHLLVPLAGLAGYLRLLAKLRKQNLVSTLGIYFLIIFVTYGGLLMVVLTAFFWRWSGMASLGTFYLLLPAPVLMGVTAYNNSKLKSLSRYHRLAFQSGLFYFAIFPLVILIMYFAGA
jgi:membrane protein insertase Oxa1/YidC/SpoIIIJ